jgi:hypothetical protein
MREGGDRWLRDGQPNAAELARELERFWPQDGGAGPPTRQTCARWISEDGAFEGLPVYRYTYVARALGVRPEWLLNGEGPRLPDVEPLRANVTALHLIGAPEIPEKGAEALFREYFNRYCASIGFGIDDLESFAEIVRVTLGNALARVLMRERHLTSRPVAVKQRAEHAARLFCGMVALWNSGGHRLPPIGERRAPELTDFALAFLHAAMLASRFQPDLRTRSIDDAPQA